MKFAAFTLSCVVIAAAALKNGRTQQAQSKLASNYMFLNDRFGPVTPLKKAINVRHHDDALKRKRAQLLRSKRVAEEVCFSGADVLFLRDATGSAFGYQTTFDEIFFTSFEIAINKTSIKGKTTYSLITFRDKPIPELGEEDDDCWEYHVGAQDGTSGIKDIMNNLELGGGWDIPENQFGASIAALNSPSTMPWRTSTANLPVVLMITDSPPHFNDDGVRGGYPDLLDYEGDFDETEEEKFCTERYYPSAAHVRSQLLVNGTQYFTLLAGEINERTYSAWAWFNDYLGQSSAYLHYEQAANGTIIDWNLIAAEIVEQISLSICPSSSSTTSTTTTATSTTTKTATSTTKTATSASETVTTTTADRSPRTIPVWTENPAGSIEIITMDGGSTRTAATPATGESTATGSNAGSEECDECAPEPQVLIALMKRPKVLEINAVAVTESA